MTMVRTRMTENLNCGKGIWRLAVEGDRMAGDSGSDHSLIVFRPRIFAPIV